MLAVWLSGNALVSINVTLRWARLVPGWVPAFGRVNIASADQSADAFTDLRTGGGPKSPIHLGLDRHAILLRSLQHFAAVKAPPSNINCVRSVYEVTVSPAVPSERQTVIKRSRYTVQWSVQVAYPDTCLGNEIN